MVAIAFKGTLSGSYRSIDFVLPHFANCGQCLHRTGIDRFECRIHGATSGLTIDDSTVWLAIVVAEFQELLGCCELRCGECLNFSARCGHDLPDGLNGSEFRPDKILDSIHQVCTRTRIPGSSGKCTNIRQQPCFQRDIK